MGYLKSERIITKNIELVLREVSDNCFDTYEEIIKMEFKESQNFDLQKTRVILRNLSESTLDSFNLEAGQFIEESIYVRIYQELQDKIKR